MKNLRTRFQGLTDTMLRFPITILLLLSVVVINAIVISTNKFDNYPRILLTFVIGASISAVSQIAYEHYHKGKQFRLLYIAESVILTVAYYFLIRNSEFTEAIVVRTLVLLFLLLVAFIWIPSIKSVMDFNESFMAAFKAFCSSVFFSGISFLGIALILVAIDTLIIPFSGEAYTHAANIIFILYAPMYFLSLIPSYPTVGKISATIDVHDGDSSSGEGEPGKKTGDGKEESIGQGGVVPSEGTRAVATGKAGDVPRFLASLLSYVIIPVTAIFTLILLTYIILNITGEFWTDSLLEPMLVTYSITVIIVYLLVSRLDSPIAAGFRRIFPKILVPVVLFQTVSSCIRIGTAGITYGRYYVILFGLFATVAGLMFCFLPVRRNGLIAPVLIILSIISVLPPLDAFTVSYHNQRNRLKKVLTDNGMLAGDVITPNSDLSDKDRRTIITSIDYLDSMDYTDEIKWLSDYRITYDFSKTFGFPRYGMGEKEFGSTYLYLDPELMIDISGYDFIRNTNIYGQEDNRKEAAFRKDGVDYVLAYVRDGGQTYLILTKEEAELVRFPVNRLFEQFEINDQENHSAQMTEEEARFTVENERAILTLTVRALNISNWQDGSNRYAEVYIMVKLK